MESIMKKLLLSLALSLGVLSAAPAMAATPAFSASQMAQVKITDLSFKEVMREFYSERMKNVYIDDSEVDFVPIVGLKNANSDKYHTVALLHSIINYNNVLDEPRYLVVIEKVLFDKNTEKLQACHICRSTSDLYSFKKLSSGMFQLVSKNSESIDFHGSWGRLGLNAKDFESRINLLGKNLVGGYVEATEKQMGFEFSDWYALHLPENNFINLYFVGDASGSSIGHYGDDSPLGYEYKGTIQALPQEASYYPIMITYKGEKPTDDNEHIEHINYSKIMKFNPVKKEYE